MFFSLDFSPFNLSPVTAGSQLNIVCNIRSDKCNRTSADLKFKFALSNRTKITISKSYITVINSTAIELNYPNIPLHFHGTIIECLLRDVRDGITLCEEDYDYIDSWLAVGCESLLLFAFLLCFLY